MNGCGKNLDYDDVKVAINDAYVEYEGNEAPPDLSFRLGALTGSIPIILYYEADEGGCEAMEKACADNGVITAGAVGTNIPLPIGKIQELTYAPLPTGFRLFEAYAPLAAVNRSAMEEMKRAGNSLVVGCSTSVAHARAVANELRLADAVLVGPTQAQTTKRLEATGVAVPRVSMVEQISRFSDVPVIVTASSPSDVCKALVAGADAALIHFGSPAENDDVGFAVEAIVGSLRETLTDLCLACGAPNVKSLAVRCKLTT